MILRAADGEATLSEPDDLTALALVVEGDREVAVGPWATWVDAEHVVVAPELLVELAGPAAEEPGWRERFDAMIAYAASRGWVTDAGVRLHVAPDDAP